VDRIAIMGCGGSGKSHLARELGARLGITPVHLDTRYYDQDWKPLDQEAFAGLQRDLVAAPRWIIDGNYASTLRSRRAVGRYLATVPVASPAGTVTGHEESR
jgi:adenylate kinase family enzyme